MRLWQALEALPGPAAVLAEWRRLAGAEGLDLLTPYLQPLPRLAASYPRLVGGEPTYPYEVVEHGPDDFVGVCPETEDRIVLARNDLVIYELDWPLFLADIAAALGFQYRAAGTDGLPAATRLVGDYRPAAGYSFPVYLTVPLESRSLTGAVCMLVSLSDGAFVLSTPTRCRLRPDAQQILERKRCCFLPLEEALAATGPRQWQATEAAVQALQGFTGLHVPSPEANDGTAFFPTPAGATWADLSIRFVDGHSVAVRVGAAGGTYHYAQMGMADGRNASPTKQWELLQVLARNHGVLTWKSPDASRKNKKRRELLARDLKAFFRIDGEPIVATDDGKGWRTTFALASDA
ncbi:hypothetical protein Isop_2458 [Isosphaera pallida ATCC 43644]|uniref:Uncharacterized protein n=1 Tax=Isosphaera pallida (strain ATCC 43644 / DSM 9630 / IS1B) TaxID=575540 RepID=E8QXI4_ISOPI|nr:hypothetical protein [Isosphaera pallida]ADV63032.1 hypothetical protein Isop_2458 [Isosphaera pallida ATCC 43644]